MTEHRVTGLRYVGLAGPDFATEHEFLRGHWGLTEVAKDGDLAYYAAAGSPEAYIFRLRGAPEKRVDVIGFAAESTAAVDGLARDLATKARLISQPGPLKSPGGGYGFRFFDIDGRTVEISSGVAGREARALKKGESIPAALSHVVLHTPEIKKTVAFYENALGFRVSDWLGEFMSFLRCNNVHHSLAFMPGPPSLNHVAFEMRDLDEMMRGTGRLMASKVPLAWGPGRHTAGNNTFSYFVSPTGNVLEYTAEVERVDDATWKPTVFPVSPAITDQWGTSALSAGPAKMPKHGADPGIHQAPPV